MADKRMFSKTIIDSDAFLDMALSTQALYFHLSMRADDDGFINNPKKILRMVGSSDDEFKILLAKKFILVFESGVIVIKHWRMHNYIQKDRYKPTVYTEELKQLTVKENKAYSLDTTCIQNGYKPETQIRLDKIRLDEDSIEENIISFPIEDIPYKEIIDYLNSRIGASYKHNTGKTKECIHARWNEGFRLDDFKKVIDNKVYTWDKEPKPDEKDMREYLRPITLFGTKFESYLNEKPQQPQINRPKIFRAEDEFEPEYLEAFYKKNC